MNPASRRLTFIVGTSLLTASFATGCNKTKPTVTPQPEETPHVNEGPAPEEEPAPEENPEADTDAPVEDGPNVNTVPS